jgi:hypothetical protein
LRNFSALTRGDTVVIWHADQQYNLDVMEVRSHAGECDAIDIIETDLEVDFEAATDQVLATKEEEERKLQEI